MPYMFVVSTVEGMSGKNGSPSVDMQINFGMVGEMGEPMGKMKSVTMPAIPRAMENGFEFPGESQSVTCSPDAPLEH